MKRENNKFNMFNRMDRVIKIKIMFKIKGRQVASGVLVNIFETIGVRLRGLIFPAGSMG